MAANLATTVQLHQAEPEFHWFRNEHACTDCQLGWTHIWSSPHADHCPTCNLECQPLRATETKPRPFPLPNPQPPLDS